MSEKFDLLMWTYNGEKTLYHTLPNLDRVIPKWAINRKIASDDRSSDHTRKILKEYGWEVHINLGKRGVGNNANNCLKHATTEFLMCFEQDILLAYNWFVNLVPELYKEKNKNVGMFSGIRLSNIKTIRNFEIYRLNKYIKNNMLLPTPIDQCIIRMKALNEINGFPKMKFAGVDSIIRRKFIKKGWKFIVDCNVISTHLRSSVKEQLNHYKQYTEGLIKVSPNITKNDLLKRVIISPLVALKIFWKTRDINQLWYYPKVRKAIYDGFKNS